jgi:hypothetical protein
MAISSFVYVTDYELGIVINDNQKGRIYSEDVTTRSVVQLGKQGIYLQTRNTCVLMDPRLSFSIVRVKCMFVMIRNTLEPSGHISHSAGLHEN